MSTHPVQGVETENITNKICSLELGKEVDITAGSCSFSRNAGKYQRILTGENDGCRMGDDRPQNISLKAWNTTRT